MLGSGISQHISHTLYPTYPLRGRIPGSTLKVCESMMTQVYPVAIDMTQFVPSVEKVSKSCFRPVSNNGPSQRF